MFSHLAHSFLFSTRFIFYFVDRLEALAASKSSGRQLSIDSTLSSSGRQRSSDALIVSCMRSILCPTSSATCTKIPSCSMGLYNYKMDW